MRKRVFIVAVPLLVLIAAVAWYLYPRKTTAPAPPAANAPPSNQASTKPHPVSKNPLAATQVYAHNLMLRKGPNFRIYVRWLHGQMTRTKKNQDPSFDNPDSFFLDIDTGVIRANIGDITNYLNASLPKDSPITHIKISGNADQVKLSGIVHKVVPLPIELDGTIAIVPDNRIRVHVNKIDVLKIPFKAILGGFHVKLADLFKGPQLPGIEVTGNDILFNTETLLPPPHIRGKLTVVRIDNPDLEEVYGDAAHEVQHAEQWRNFLRLRDGSIDFGRLTMHPVDLIMIDISKDAWFDLDLANYQAQMVNGYTRMTPQAGLQIFMPDLDELPPKTQQNISMQWLKDRNAPPPAEITQQKK